MILIMCFKYVNYRVLDTRRDIVRESDMQLVRIQQPLL